MADHARWSGASPRGGALRPALALALVACGGSSSTPRDAALPPIDAVDAPVDAPALAPCPDPVAGTAVRLRPVAVVNGSAVLVTAPIGDRRLFVVEQRGSIRIIDEAETLLPEPFLDLSDDAGGPVVARGEQGLLGLAFHPEYAANGQFFVFYTRRATDAEGPHAWRDVVARCQRSAADPNKAEPACVDVLAIPDSFTNHNGGMIEFGPDGLLYIGTGDGGNANDPQNNAQALTDDPATGRVALLGKMLRIDVDTRALGKEYGIPADNPFPEAPEVFMLGLRNPWRWSFDRATGDIWIGDVGQGAIEEIDVVRAGEGRGVNFGWDIWEGATCVAGAGCPMTGMEFPAEQLDHLPKPTGDGFEAIIGGQVYRGTCFPDLAGTYFFADNGSRTIGAARLQADGTLATQILPPPPDQSFPSATSSIHADARGELYLTTTLGDVFQIVAGP